MARTRSFTESDLLICDANDVPIGIGGVMGGLDTEITESTTTVVLEIAWFNQLTVLQTAARLGLRSEASARYERGCDPYVIDTAQARFVELLRETCPELVVHAGYRRCSRSRPSVPARTFGHRADVEVNRILGTQLDADDLPRLLDPIGFTVTGDGDTRTVATAVWRPDSEAEVDVIEEVARHYGYERIGKSCPSRSCTATCRCVSTVAGSSVTLLLGLGITEAMPNPFLAPDTLAKAGLDGPTISITNPLVVEESVLRTSLRPGPARGDRLQRVAPPPGAFALFEIGHVYPPGDGELPDEYEALCVVLAGGAGAGGDARCGVRSPTRLGVGARIDQGRVPPGLHATRSAVLQAGKRPTGAVGEVDPAVLQRFDVDERVAILELNLDEILGREPEADRLEAGQPDAVERSRLWRSCWMTMCRPRNSSGRFARASASCSSISNCSTCSAGQRSARAGAVWRTACACRPPTAT